MDRRRLRQYRALKQELESLEGTIEQLSERAMEIPTVKGKVTASGLEWPYIEQHVTVEMADPKEADAIKRRIRIKKIRKTEAECLAAEIEEFIAGIPDSTDRRIFEMSFLEGKTQQEISDEIHLERSGISKRISKYLEVSHNSQK